MVSLYFSQFSFYIYIHRLTFQKGVWDYHGDTAELCAAGSKAQILLDRVSEKHGTEYFVSRSRKHHPYLVFANVVTTMRYMSAHKLNMGCDPCLLYAFPCVLHLLCWGGYLASQLHERCSQLGWYAAFWPATHRLTT